MEEKIIIQGDFSKKYAISTFLLIIAAILMVISFGIFIVAGDGDFLSEALSFACPEGIGVCFYASLLFIILAVVFGVGMKYSELIVTDKRVYGKVIFGKSIDLPYDAISSVGTCFPKGVFASTASGAVRFWLLSNQNEVYKEISNLLKQRQEKATPTLAPVINQNTTNADEIKKFKDLLDVGAITQEEYDAKKKELLDL